jgi:hypothetical protein
MKTTSNYTITKVQRGIFTVLLLSQLLTSCGGEAREIGTDPKRQRCSPTVLSEAVRRVGHVQEVSYVNMAGNGGSMQIDPANTTIAAFLALVKQKDNLFDSVCRLVYQGDIYKEDDARLLHSILDPTTIEDPQLTIVTMSNASIAQELLGANYLGEDAWKKLGIEDSDIPSLLDEMLAEARRLQTQGEQPLLLLDLGKSIADIERLCTAKGITVLKADGDDEKLRAETFYQATVKDFRWLLLPGSDHGVLPGSRKKTYGYQVQYMEANYPGYAVGGVRELVTLAMLKQIQDGTLLFPEEPHTWGRCKEQYQTGNRKGGRVCLGGNSKNDSGSVSGLVVSSSGHVFNGLFACVGVSR